MSTQTVGRAWLVEQNIPSAVNISGATNATPIVVTTTIPHGLRTNNLVYIVGVTGNTAANGYFVASVLSPTTFALTSYPARTNVAGSGAYVSGGQVQNLDYGITVPIPNDLTDLEVAGSVNVPHEAELDRLSWLIYQDWLSIFDRAAIRAAVPVFSQAITVLTVVATGGTALETLAASTGGAGTGTQSAYAYADIPMATAGDIIMADLAIDASADGNAAHDLTLKLIKIEDYGGTPFTADMQGVALLHCGNPTGTRSRLVINAMTTIVNSGPLRVVLGVYGSSGGDDLSNYGSGSLRIVRRHIGI